MLSFYAVWRELQLFLTEIFPRKQFDNNGFIDVSVEGQNGFQVQWVILPVFSTLWIKKNLPKNIPSIFPVLMPRP